MSRWLNAIRDRLTRDVLCYRPPRLRGKNIIQTSEKEFCVDPVVEAAVEAAAEASKRVSIISMSSVAVVVVVLLSVIAIFYRLRVKLYTRWKFHPFDRDECPGEDMDYDVFICCSSLDDRPIGRRILELVEANGYRVCYHERDFMPGLITDNIEASVTRSKRTVCLLTNHFIQRSANVYLVSLLILVRLCSALSDNCQSTCLSVSGFVILWFWLSAFSKCLVETAWLEVCFVEIIFYHNGQWRPIILPRW